MIYYSHLPKAVRQDSPSKRDLNIRLALFLTLFVFSFNLLKAQKGTNFYLIPYNKEDLAPISKNRIGKTLQLTFTNPSLTNLFNSFNVLSYQTTFEELNCSEYLKKVYEIRVEDSISLQEFTNNPLIVHAEIVPSAQFALNSQPKNYTEQKLAPLTYDCSDIYNIPNSVDLPNDYYIPTLADRPDYPCDSIPNDYLTLIQAPCAWKITHGDPNIIVGISDSFFSEEHEELNGKFDTIWGSSAYQNNYNHGIGVASLIAGNTNNGKGTASIGFNTRLVGAYGGSLVNRVKELVLWGETHNNKLRVINMSWHNTLTPPQNYPPSPIMAELFKCIRDQYNIVLVAAAGNTYHNGTNDIVYAWPASYSSVISVTAVGSRFHRSSSINDSLWIDVAPWWPNHSWPLTANDSVNLSAPGYRIFRASNEGEANVTNTYTQIGRGTSQAAPIVSGTAALVLAVNPNLTAKQVARILEVTADKIDTIPENLPYAGLLGSGRINAYKAVKMGQFFDQYGYDYEAIPSSLDLMIRDNTEDIGEEPNETTEIFWNSPDIWVRNQPDGIEQHQNPEYNPFEKSYIYVRIKNIGCDPSSTDDQLKLYWTKANASMHWPDDYMGDKYFSNGALQGDTIASVNLPIIKPGEEKIIQVPWSNIPDPEDYTDINENPWHFCLLARIISDEDPIHIETESIAHSDKYNNNIASRNLTVLDFNPSNINQPISGGFIINNPNNQVGIYDLQLIPDAGETGSMIYEEAEVSVILDKTLIDAWVDGGEVSNNLRRTGTNTFLVMDTDARLKNLIIPASDFGIATLQFNFLTKEITEKQTFLYHGIQREAIYDTILGGESFEINKWPRILFYANINSETEFDIDDEIELKAVSIGEPALYNWYDMEGNLIYEGVDFDTSVEIGKRYKLEVIALSDGYKDYSEVKVKYKPNRITEIYPNPTTGQLTIKYQINKGNSAYLMITPVSLLMQNANNYLLDLDEQQTTLNLSNLSTGEYLVVLTIDGEVADTKHIIKN